jgi:poly(beta-D-mannuronate) lyase
MMRALFVVIGLLGACIPSHAQQRLLSAPFETAPAQANPAQANPANANPANVATGADMAACPAPPPPVRDLSHSPFYTNAEASNRDEALFRQQLQKTEALRDFARRIASLSGATRPSEPLGTARAACALAWLDRWASQNALLGEVTTWARFDTIWFAHIAAGVSYLKIRSEPGLDAAARQRVEGWLVRVARAAVNEENAVFRPRKMLTNHHYWAGAAASIAGVAAQDQELAGIGFRSALTGLAAIDSRGVLPAELARQGRAFTYHVWALEPIMLSLVMARHNGTLVSPVLLDRLQRTMTLIRQARSDGKLFERLSGHRQVVETTRWPSETADFAFAELYLNLVPDAEWEAVLAGRRPVVSERLGADVSALFPATRSR